MIRTSFGLLSSFLSTISTILVLSLSLMFVFFLYQLSAQSRVGNFRV